MRTSLLSLSLLLAVPALRAQDEESKNALTRDESASFKKALNAVIDALGQPPEGLVRNDVDYNLPTEFTPAKGGVTPIGASAQLAFGGATGKVKKSQKQFETDTQKKMQEALARGDYAAMAQIGQEAQSQGAALGGEQMKEQSKGKISVSVQLNGSAYETIDADNVLLEKPGVLGLKFPSGEEGDDQLRAVVYFDPVSLKDTKKLSALELKQPEDGVKSKLAVLTAVIELTGEAAQVETWVKRIDTKAVLAQIKN